jgi:type IV pilus assembly protein PilP
MNEISMTRHARRVGGVLVLTLVIAGCVNDDRSDLERYVAEVLARPGGQIEPLPPIKPYERYLYVSAEASARDPFASFRAEKDTQRVAVAPEQDPRQKAYTDEILAHNREELENFELDGLRMVGTLKDDAALWAIILDTTGTVHRVQVGNYLGQNYGKIIEILDDHLELREVVKDSSGLWEERRAKLTLNEAGNL